ncbi:RNA-directed DNA polymerase, eukaryota, reverse transcriptase zinc-binding domain protein [Tanacetum coccineum]
MIADHLPFTYLGVPVGCNMNHIDSWKPMIDKFNKKLSSWKAKLLSVGGQLTLIKSIMGSLAIYYMYIFKVLVTVLQMLESLRARFFWGADLGERKLHWIVWNRVLTARDSGGLGLGSLAAFNKALLFKWIWIFRDNPNALWARIVSSIHDTHREEGALPSSRFGGLSPWVNISRAMEHLEVKGFHMDNFYRIKVGIGDKTSFWRDRWLGNRPLMEQFLRLSPLDPDPDAKVVERNSSEKLLAVFGREPRSGIPNSKWITLQGTLQAFIFSEAPDHMEWDLDESGVFSVSSMRSCLDSFLLCSSRVPTRWNMLVPRKLNILTWRIFRDRIPTRLNLRDKGIDLESLLCHVYMHMGESTEHLFSSCPNLCPLWHRITVWWGVTTSTEMTIKSLVTWADDIALDAGIDQGVGSTSGIRACAMRNFDLEVMELENSQNNALAKLPMLKLKEYEMWEIRIKQYFQIQDYALWEVIKNGNLWVPIPVTSPTETGTSTGTKMTVPSTVEEKTCKKE